MEKKIDKRVIKLWMLRRSFLMLILFIATLLTFVFALGESFFAYIAVPLIFADLLWAFYSYVFCYFQYNRYSYEVSEDSITFNYGVIFRNTFVIPFVQVQDISSHQGPLQILFKVKTVVFSTAGSNHILFGLNNEIADKMIIDIKNYVHTLVLKDKE